MIQQIARRIRVHGQVQGVCFRDWAIAQAKALSLDGWVRNRLDGTVEILARGLPEAIESLVAACRQGPPAAHVERVEVEDSPGLVAAGFTRKPTV